jgi:hypothetical protein
MNSLRTSIKRPERKVILKDSCFSAIQENKNGQENKTEAVPKNSL